MPDGFQVDPAALTRAAEAGAGIARDTRPLVKELATALDDLAGGAPGSQSASVAASAARQWTGTLSHHADQIQGVCDKLKQTADDYLGQDQAAAGTISKIKPAATPRACTGRPHQCHPRRPDRLTRVATGHTGCR
jgi:ABC-type transporter Mla subunit MlaD